MDVQVHNRLAGGGADVDADVVSIGAELFVEEGFCLPDEGEQRCLLLHRRSEEACDMPKGDDEEVAGARRKSIVAGVAEIVFEHDLPRRRPAERAGQRAHASYPLAWMR